MWGLERPSRLLTAQTVDACDPQVAGIIDDKLGDARHQRIVTGQLDKSADLRSIAAGELDRSADMERKK